MGIMDKKMESTILWEGQGDLVIMEKKMDTTILFRVQGVGFRGLRKWVNKEDK